MRVTFRQPAKFAIAHGFRMRVLPERRVEWSQGFQHATEKYAAQVTLDSDDYIKNYVAGMPFPLVEANRPEGRREDRLQLAHGTVHAGRFFARAVEQQRRTQSDPANALMNRSERRRRLRLRAVRFPALCPSHGRRSAPDHWRQRDGRRVEGEMQSMDQRSLRQCDQRRRRYLGALSRREASRRIFLIQ